VQLDSIENSSFALKARRNCSVIPLEMMLYPVLLIGLGVALFERKFVPMRSIMARKWNDQQKKQQSEKIRQWMPWLCSTGARTREGKAITSQNAALGKRKKQAAIEQAKQELIAAQVKLWKLTTKRGEW
jgi:hypothetical protein